MDENGRENPAQEKRFYKISEMAALAGVAPSVLRFWESEFSQIKPKRTLSGQRVYRAEDAALIMRIKELLYDKRFTIPGARKLLKEEARKSLIRPLSASSEPEGQAASCGAAEQAQPTARESTPPPQASETLSLKKSELVAVLSDIRRMLQ